MKKVFSVLLLTAILLTAMALPSCKPAEKPEEEDKEKVVLNIIDDNYRNWYEIFVHSFYDSDNDGIGDLYGVTAKLDYIQEMGFNGI